MGWCLYFPIGMVCKGRHICYSDVTYYVAEAVVAESVVVIKRLLQTQAADPKEIITHMARLLDSITVAQARAAILWLLGEHSQKVPDIAPDILRKLAKTFVDEVFLFYKSLFKTFIYIFSTTLSSCR